MGILQEDKSDNFHVKNGDKYTVKKDTSDAS
jgi:hypothetical protein